MSPTHMAIVLSRDPSATGYAHTRGEEDSRRTEMASFPVRYGVDAVETEEDPPYCPHGGRFITDTCQEPLTFELWAPDYIYMYTVT